MMAKDDSSSSSFQDYCSSPSEDSSSSEDSSDSSDNESEQGNNDQQEPPKAAALIKKPEAAVIKKQEAVIKKQEAVIKKHEAVIKKQESVIKKQETPRKVMEFDDREETLQLVLQRVNNGDREIPPPLKIVSKIPINEVEFIMSKCIYKQLTESDVNVVQSRVALGTKQVKDHFLCYLEESEISRLYIEGINVLVYGPDGKSHEMKFKVWMKKNNHVLNKGWNQFVKAYGLRKYSHLLRIWMFRTTQDRQICFAIDPIRFDGITKPLSKRILKTAFKD